MKKLIKNNVYWVGKIDWDLRKFHGDEYSTHTGSSYNSYLIKEEKNVLIDTVWKPFSKEFIENLSTEINLNDIDYIIINHSEVDHSGALVDLMELIPDTPIYCTASAEKILRGHYHKDWNFNIVKTGDSIDIGNGKSLVFVEMKMLHWPDSMATYLTNDNILFSNDAFGQHHASDLLFNDLVDQCELEAEAIKYYANILTPFSAILKKKLQEVLALNLPIDIIATSHGVIWRDNPGQIIELYSKWCDNYQENQMTILYDTMWDGTKKLAEAIAEGIRLSDSDVVIKVFNISKHDKNDMITEIFKSKTVLLGSSTINNGILSGVAGLLEEVKGLRFKNKKAGVFGCYGWSGESTKIMRKELESAGFDVFKKEVKELWNPSKDAIKNAIDFGKEISEY